MKHPKLSSAARCPITHHTLTYLFLDSIYNHCSNVAIQLLQNPKDLKLPSSEANSYAV